MESEIFLTPEPARDLIRSFPSRRLGFVGSPAIDFRDTWRTDFASLWLEIGDEAFEFSCGRDQSDSNGTFLMVQQARQRGGERDFPRYGWWSDQTIEQCFVVRDTLVEREAHRSSRSLTWDTGVVLRCAKRTICIFLDRPRSHSGIGLAHEPTGRDVIIHTMPSTREDAYWLLSSEHLRVVLPVEEAWR